MRFKRLKLALTVAAILGVLAKGSITAAPMPGGLQLGDSFFDVFYDLTALVVEPDADELFPRRLFFDIFVDLDPGPPVSLGLLGHGRGLLQPHPGPIVPIELVALELRGIGVRETPSSPSQPALLRESPTRTSMGRTLLQEGNPPLNPPLMLDSFFDVFTEISLDGGSNWEPLGNRIVTIPEGGSTLLLSLIPAALCGWWVSRRAVSGGRRAASGER